MKFAAFIMTFERANILPKTIKILLKQTYPPEEILIVDNSESYDTYNLWKKLNNEKISYHSMGFNAGPAGAAHFALGHLTKKGYDWIFWGDDDDPPENEKVLEYLLNLAVVTPNTGIVGSRGGKFIKNRARTRNFYNKELNGVMDADYIAGNQMMIVNAKVVKEGILPTKKLFFGFEELDFCLKVKENNFRVIFNGDIIKKLRENRGVGNPSYKWKGKSFGNENTIWRQYYSIRNMLFILKSRRLYIGYIFFALKNSLKIPLSFRFGWTRGKKASRVYCLAFWHHLINKYDFYSRNKI